MQNIITDTIVNAPLALYSKLHDLSAKQVNILPASQNGKSNPRKERVVQARTAIIRYIIKPNASIRGNL